MRDVWKNWGPRKRIAEIEFKVGSWCKVNNSVLYMLSLRCLLDVMWRY